MGSVVEKDWRRPTSRLEIDFLLGVSITEVENVLLGEVVLGIFRSLLEGEKNDGARFTLSGEW